MTHRIQKKRRRTKVKASASLPILRAIQGVILSLGAPLGWIIVQIAAGRSPLAEEYLDSLLYTYMTFATAILFAGVGWIVGRREAFITRLALRDELTGLYNKRFFFSKLEIDMDQYRRDGTALSIILCDLDYFKVVNDTHGHPAGDEVLKSVAALLQQHCRRNDIAARTGGEEFCIILAGTGLEDAMNSAERVRKAIEESDVAWQGKAIPITASFGVTTSSPSRNEIDSLIEAADQALYQAKEEGRNRVCSRP